MLATNTLVLSAWLVTCRTSSRLSYSRCKLNITPDTPNTLPLSVIPRHHHRAAPYSTRFVTLTSSTPSVSTPLASSRCTNLHPSLSRSTLTHAQAARSSLPISSSRTVNRTNASSGTTPATLPNPRVSPNSGSLPLRVLVRALYSPSFSRVSCSVAREFCGPTRVARSSGSSTCSSTLT